MHRESADMSSFSARVVGGRGEAAALVDEYHDEIFRMTGVDCVSGSLNLVFEQPVGISTSSAQFFGHHRRLWQGTLNGVPVLVARWKRSRQHICEIYADRHLRSTLDLTDGDGVELSLFDSDLEQVQLRVRVAWVLLWSKGRGSLYFSSDLYRALTSPIEIVLRSLQS